MDIQLRIRIGNAYDGDPETKTFRNATFAEAVEALRGTVDEDGDTISQNVYVVGTYAQGFSEDLGTSTKPRVVERKEDEPVFGLEVSVYPQRTDYWSRDERKTRPCEVNWSALGSTDTDTAQFYAGLLMFATQIAAAANASL